MDEQAANSALLDFNLAVIMHNFINAAKRLLWLVLLAALVVGFSTFYTANLTYSPTYSSSAVFSVHASYAATIDILSSSSIMDSSATKTLASTFSYVIGSENTRMLLEQELHENVVASISATSAAETAIFTLTVTAPVPEDAYRVLKAAIKVYPQAASSILGDTQIQELNMPEGPPTAPINPNNAFSLGLVAGLIVFAIGTLCIFLLSLTRKTIHSAEDLRKLVNLKCLAYIPIVNLKKHSNKANLTLTITNPRITSKFNESIRNLRVKLQKQLDTAGSCVMLVTSTLPHEGKTTVATNLALSLAQEGKRVILIDGDLRKQSLKESLGIVEPSDGLVEILTGQSKDFHLLNVPKSTLLLLSGDETIDQPQPLLDTPRMKQLIDLLRDKLDFIIFDTPPAGILSDAATIAKYADSTLYIVRQDLANTTQILTSIQGLSSAGVNIVGCVLNQTQAGTTRYGYGSKYGTGYTYGYKYASSYDYRRTRYGRYAKAEFDAEELSRQINETPVTDLRFDDDD